MNPLTPLFSEGLLKDLGVELGISADAPEMQGAALALIGETITTRLMVEIAKKIPESERGRLGELVGKGEEMIEFLTAHIPDLDTFIQDEARKECAEIMREAKSP